MLLQWNVGEKSRNLVALIMSLRQATAQLLETLCAAWGTWKALGVSYCEEWLMKNECVLMRDSLLIFER
jgi:hypothetical protein